MTTQILNALGLSAINSGTYLGKGEWAKTSDAGLLQSINPSTNEVIAEVHASSESDYETIITRAQQAFAIWRTTPAPRRGEAVRLCGEALRKHKDALGSLVALEMGKIKPEGDGEVQEMIDIADFAVGQSRMLYGYTMHSERPRPSHVRAMASRWTGWRDQRVQLPGCGVGLELLPCRHLWRHHHLEALAEDAAVGHRQHEDLQRGLACRWLPGHFLPVQRCRYGTSADLR